MRGKRYTDGNTVARVCNGNRAVIIHGKLGNRFICERRMNADHFLKEKGFRIIERKV